MRLGEDGNVVHVVVLVHAGPEHFLWQDAQQERHSVGRHCVAGGTIQSVVWCDAIRLEKLIEHL